MVKDLLNIMSLLVFPVAALAQGQGIGSVAENLMSPVSVFSDFINTGCLLIGGLFIFASIIKYVEHRRSPTMVPISTVVFLLVAGIVLIALPLAYLITENGIPYSLSK